MIENYGYADLFWENDVQKNYIITDGVVSIAGGSFVYGNYTYLLMNDDLKNVPKIHEMLTDSKDLDFGRCNSNYIEFSIAADVMPLIDKTCRVYLWMNNDKNTLMRLGKYKVTSDKATADRNYRNIVAYDPLYEMKNADVTEWYNSLFPTPNSRTSVRAMRQSFCRYFDLDDATLLEDQVNDLVEFGKTISPSDGGYIKGETILWGLCSINGGFGNISRNGDFRNIVLASGLIGLYPSVELFPAEDLYPREDKTHLIGQAFYIPPLGYEDYYTDPITCVQIREDDEDIGVSVGEAGNDYILEGNFILYGKDATELEEIATRLLNKIKGMSYMPFNVRAFGNPVFEVGDPVRFRTGDVRVNSYILKRTLSGTTALSDEYESVGNLHRDDKTSNIPNDIVKLKSKTLKIQRNVDEFSVELHDFETATASQFRIQAGQISSKVSTTDYNGNTIASLINQTATTIQIQASKIKLEGNTLINGTFRVDSNGYIRMKSQNLDISDSSGNNHILSVWNNELLMWDGGMRLEPANDGTWLNIAGGAAAGQTGSMFDHVAINGDKVHIGYQSDDVDIYHCTGIYHGTSVSDDPKITMGNFEVRLTAASSTSASAPFIYIGDPSDSPGIRLRGDVAIGRNSGSTVILKGSTCSWTSFTVRTITIDGTSYNVLTTSDTGSKSILTGS